MNKIKYIIIFVLGLILLFILIFILSNSAENKRIYDKFVYNSWNRTGDEYTSINPVSFPGDPISNTFIYFSNDKINFCNNQENENVNDTEENLEEDAIGEQNCSSYNFEIKRDNLIVDYDGKKIEYIYEFVGDNELILIYKTDDYVFKFFYNASAG